MKQRRNYSQHRHLNLLQQLLYDTKDWKRSLFPKEIMWRQITEFACKKKIVLVSQENEDMQQLSLTS